MSRGSGGFWLGLAGRIDGLNRALGRLSSVLVPVMLAIGAWNVVGRYLGGLLGRNLSSNALIEAQWQLFAVIFLLGASTTLQSDGHVRVDVLQSRWGPRRRLQVELLGTLLFLVPFCLLVLGMSWGAVSNSWSILEGSPDPDGLPRFPIKTMVLVGFGLLLLQGVSQAIRLIDRLRNGERRAAGGERRDG
jgi:TRAP-type mannitol/chloroaromatic compound transport system permease small subunit